MLPALRVELRQLDRRRRARVDQTGPQPQLVRTVAGAPHADANLAEVEPLENLAGALPRAVRNLDQARAIGQAFEDARLGRSRCAQQEVAAHTGARGPRVRHKRCHPIQPIAEQQRSLGQVRQQALGQGPFRFAVPPDGGRERIVQAHFQQDRGRHLGEGRAPAAGPRFHDARQDLRSVGQTELRAIEGHQTPAPPERLALPLRRQGPQDAAHQLGKDLPRQARSPIGPRTVGQRGVEQLREMLGQGAGSLHHMEGQGGQQVASPGRAVSARGAAGWSGFRARPTN